MSMKVNKDGKGYPIGVIPQNIIRKVLKLNKSTVFENATADANGIYTSSLGSERCVKSAYSSDGYMVIPFMSSGVWKFQLLTNSGTSFVNGANATTNIHVFYDDV